MPSPTITPFVLGDYQTNCYVVTPGAVESKASGQTGECWIVDCGFEPDEMFEWIDRNKLKPVAILLTHSHLDHIGGVDEALSKYGSLPMYIHIAEANFCSNPMLNLSAMSGMPVTCTEPDNYLKDGDTLTLGDSTWRVLRTPGHSPGGACFINDESKQALVGDTLFAGGIGRFDFPTSDRNALRNSIQNVLMKLPDDMTIYPGHGPKTTIGRERRTNPFVVGGF